MRDIFFLFIIPFIFYAVLKRPFIGAAMWLWVSMFYPNGWVYGFAGNFRYNLLIVIVAVISYVKWPEKETIPRDKLTFFIIFFLLWTFITSIFTISIPEVVWAEWIEFLKITLFFIFTIAVVRTQLHLNVLIWALVLSIGFYGCLEGLKYIASGGGHRIAGLSGHVLGDRNELALAFNMLLPLVAYLIGTSKGTWIKLGLFCVMILTIVAIIGTYSRGGTIALIVIGGYFWLQSKRKILYTILLVISFSIASNYIPSSWSNRMDSLETAQKDSSFLGRALAWKQAILMANDNLITGGGFKAGQTAYVWWSYDAAGSFNNIIDTSHMHEQGFKAAHSIYFQVLGDHGYIGLLLFLLILSSAFFKALKLARVIKKNDLDKTLGTLCSLITVSILAYCAGGAGVSLAYFDMLYALLAMVFVLEHRLIPQALFEKKAMQSLKNRTTENEKGRAIA